MDPLLIGTGVQAAMGVAQLAQSAAQAAEAKKMQKSLVRPEYRAAQPVKDNYALAESRASQGMTDAAMSVYENNMDRAMTTSIDAILMGGGNVNSIADLYDSAEDNFANLALLEEELRLKNTQMYMAAGERLAEELDKEFQINEWAPYKDKQQAIAMLSDQANANKWAGMNTIGQAAGNYVQGNMMKAETRNVFGKTATVNAGGGPSFGSRTRLMTDVLPTPTTDMFRIPYQPPVPNSPLQPRVQQPPSYADYMGQLIQTWRRP